jgi:hypothetical protein
MNSQGYSSYMSFREEYKHEMKILTLRLSGMGECEKTLWVTSKRSGSKSGISNPQNGKNTAGS